MILGTVPRRSADLLKGAVERRRGSESISHGWDCTTSNAGQKELGLAAVVFEVFFYFEGGHAAGAGGGDGLAVLAVLDVAAGVDAGNDLPVQGAVDIVLAEDVAVGVEIHHAFEGGGVGLVADAEEHEGDREDGLVAVDAVLEAEALDVLLFDAEDLFDEGVVEEVDAGMGLGALEHDGAGAELLGAVDEGDFGGEAGEEEGFLHGAVAAADDGDLLAGGEEAIAGGAGGDAVADEGLLGGEVEPAGGGAGRDDEGAGLDGLAAEVKGDGGVGLGGELGCGEVGHAELGTEAGGLLLHVLDELGALDALRPAGEVFDEGGDGELATGLVALEDEGLEVGTGGVDGGGEAGAAGAEDDGVADLGDRGVRVWRNHGLNTV